MYLWLKAFHIIAVVAWMAGLLYLPRLFVYHCAAERGSRQSETFKLMEQRLLTRIMNPAMLATWVLGLLLVWLGGLHDQGWLQLKFGLVVVLSIVHGFFVRWVKEFALDQNCHSARFYRFANEIPAILLVLIVLLVVLKPF